MDGLPAGSVIEIKSNERNHVCIIGGASVRNQHSVSEEVSAAGPTGVDGWAALPRLWHRSWCDSAAACAPEERSGKRSASDPTRRTVAGGGDFHGRRCWASASDV